MGRHPAMLSGRAAREVLLHSKSSHSGGRMNRLLLLAICSLLFAQPAEPYARTHPITVDDLWEMGRIGDLQVSPDAQTLAYTATFYDMEKNQSNSDIWLLPTSGGRPTKFTQSEKGDSQPRWSPDGKTIAFTSSRSGVPQIWLLPVNGGEARQLTHMATGGSGAVWSPNGESLAFASRVFLDCQDAACQEERLRQQKEQPTKARIFDRLLFRHWDSWRDERWSHLFVVPTAGGTPQDLIQGAYDVPPISLGGVTDYAFSPDGEEICFTMNRDPMVAVGIHAVLLLDSCPPVIKSPTNLRLILWFAAENSGGAIGEQRAPRTLTGAFRETLHVDLHQSRRVPRLPQAVPQTVLLY